MPTSLQLTKIEKYLHSSPYIPNDKVATLEEIKNTSGLYKENSPPILPPYLFNEIKFKIDLKTILKECGISYDEYRFLCINHKLGPMYEKHGFQSNSKIFIHENDFLDYKSKILGAVYLDVAQKRSIAALEHLFRGRVPKNTDFRFAKEQIMAWCRI